MAESLLAAILWPILAITWAHRRLLLRHQDRRPAPAGVAELHGIPQDQVFSEYDTLTRAMFDARRSTVPPSSELFELAGHSNAKVAAICSERKRNALLSRRQRASSAALIDHLRSSLSSRSDGLTAVLEFCRDLGDTETVLSVEQIRRECESQISNNSVKHSAERERLAA